MNAIIVLAITAIICMYLGVYNLKKLGLPVAIIGIIAALVIVLTNQQGDFSTLLYNMVAFDSMSTSFSAILLIVTGFIFWASRYYYTESIDHLTDIYALFLFSLIGGLVLVSYQNLVMLFLGVEILSIPLYILAGSNRRNIYANEAGLKYFLLGSFAACFLLLGITLVYGSTGTFDISKIGIYISQNGTTPIFLIGILLMIGAFVFKIAAVPFHFWAPDVYQGSPTILTSYLATVGKIATFGALIRLINQALMGVTDMWHHVFYGIAILTMVFGSIITLNQTNLKRLLAYTGIANVGFLLIAIVALNAESYVYILYYFLGYSIATVAGFSVYSTIKNSLGIDSIEGLKGLITHNKLLTLTLIFVMLSFAGIPPLAGFFGKFFIFTNALKGGEIALVIVAVITSVISAFNYIRLMSHTVSSGGNIAKIDLLPDYRLFLVVSILAIVLIGLFPDAVLGFLG
jgi:NADH-quinone oxidoreductase subunit N